MVSTSVPPISSIVMRFCSTCFSLYKDIYIANRIQFNISLSLYARFVNTSLSKQSTALSDSVIANTSMHICVLVQLASTPKENKKHISSHIRAYISFITFVYSSRKTTTKTGLNFRSNKTRATRHFQSQFSSQFLLRHTARLEKNYYQLILN